MVSQDHLLTVTLFPNKEAKVKAEVEVTWGQLIEHIKSPDISIDKTGCPYIKLAKFGDIPSPKNCLRHDANVLSIYGVEVDMDITDLHLGVAVKSLEEVGVAAILYTSASHCDEAPRYRVLCPTSTELSPDERYQLVGRINGVLNGECAGESFTLSQSYYFGRVQGSNYQVYVAEGNFIDLCPHLDETAFFKRAGEKSYQRCGGHTEYVYDGNAALRREQCIATIKEGNTYYQELLTLTAMYATGGSSVESIVEQVQEIMLDSNGRGSTKWEARFSQIEDLAQSAYDKFHIDVPPVEINLLNPQNAPVTLGQYLANYPRDKTSKKIAPNRVNLLSSLGYYQIAFDTFRNANMVGEKGVWRAIASTDIAQMCHDLENAGFGAINTERFKEMLELYGYKNKWDSAITWANTLKEWDGVDRISTLLSVYFGCQDSIYTKAVSKYMATSMAGRLLEPGIKADMAIVLTSGQGKNKTETIIALCPLEEAFVEIDFAAKSEDACRMLQGALIAELSELKGLRSKDAEHIKSFISRRVDKWIPKFKELSISNPRRCIFIGTSNEDDFLADHTGNRRWLPLRLSHSCDVEAVKRDRDQIWAQAIGLFKQGGIAWQGLEELANKEHEQFMSIDPLEEIILNRLEGLLEGLGKGAFKVITQEIWNTCGPIGKELDRANANRIGRIMTKNGWQRCEFRVHNGKFKGWFCGANEAVLCEYKELKRAFSY